MLPHRRSRWVNLKPFPPSKAVKTLPLGFRDLFHPPDPESTTFPKDCRALFPLALTERGSCHRCDVNATQHHRGDNITAAPGFACKEAQLLISVPC